MNENVEVLLISGIANPKPLKKFLADNTATYYEILYGDHHIFSIDDLKEMRKRFENIQSDNKIILTTEKDSVRLTKFSRTLMDYPFYVIPIEVRFLFGDEPRFTELISKFISRFNYKNSKV